MKMLFAALMIIGFLIVLGSAGCIDQSIENLTAIENRMWIQMGIGLGIIFAGFIGIYIMECKEIEAGKKQSKILYWDLDNKKTAARMAVRTTAEVNLENTLPPL